MPVKCGYCKKIGTIDHVRNCPQRYKGWGPSRRWEKSDPDDVRKDARGAQDYESYSAGGHSIDEAEPLRVEGVSLRDYLDDEDELDHWNQG